MTRDELLQNDGREGRKAYVAVNGHVYDFTASGMWQNGDHQGAHQAGCDLTEALKEAPHVRAVIERFPVVGRLEEPTGEQRKNSKKGIITGLVVVAIILVAIIVFVL